MTSHSEWYPIADGKRPTAVHSVHRLLNPWVSIWAEPRATLRQILDTDPVAYVWVLAVIGGISRALDRASFRSLGDQLSLPAVLIGCVLGGALSGILMLYLFAMVMRWTGRWLGGTATPEGMRAAIAWPHVLTAWSLGLWLLEFVLFGNELFTSETPRIDGNPLLALMLLGLLAVELVIGIWFVVVLLKCVGEAQGFSAWRALANTILGGIVIAAPFIALGVLMVMFAT